MASPVNDSPDWTGNLEGGTQLQTARAQYHYTGLTVGLITGIPGKRITLYHLSAQIGHTNNALLLLASEGYGTLYQTQSGVTQFVEHDFHGLTLPVGFDVVIILPLVLSDTQFDSVNLTYYQA